MKGGERQSRYDEIVRRGSHVYHVESTESAATLDEWRTGAEPVNLLKEVLAHEVTPALGCTEPIACAYAAAVAAERLGEPVEALDLVVDTGTYKNGAAVTVPHSDGARGNVIAAALGAVLAQPEDRLALLRHVTPSVLKRARGLMTSYVCMPDTAGLRIDVTVRGGGHSARCVLAHGHTTIECIEKDGEGVAGAWDEAAEGEPLAYRAVLRERTIRDLLEAAAKLDDADRQYIQDGVDMNLAMAVRGEAVAGAASQLRHMKAIGIVADDLLYRVKVQVASAVDARMAGVPQAVMTSGGSGNQGLLAILTPYLVGRGRDVPADRVLESIAVAHMLNAYVKCYLGELSVICGCAIAAAIGAAAAIVYQHCGVDVEKVTHAINNVIGDLSGLICDGAKPGCSMKTVSSIDAAIRAGFMAVEGFGLSDDEGVLGRSAEDSIRNLGRISLEGMTQVDPTVVDILAGKGEAGQGRG